MSELINTATPCEIKWQLLSSVAASALFAAVTITQAAAAEENRPTVWIELGGQLERLGVSQDNFIPDFVQTYHTLPYLADAPMTVRALPRYGIAGEGKITFHPKGTDWTFSVGVLYGRTQGKKAVHNQAQYFTIQKNGFPTTSPYFGSGPRFFTKFNHTTGEANQQHTLLDFKVGKDVGLGALSGGSSTLNLGIRYAQFESKSAATFRSFPYFFFPSKTKYNATKARLRTFYGTAQEERSFHGIGPSLSWDASAPLTRDDEQSLTFDWGLNAALLFGRQKVEGSHMSRGRLFKGGVDNNPPTEYTRHYTPIDRKSSKLVPNVGGFAGMSFRYINAKVSLGYRADFFFGAMDGGIDVRKNEDRSFHGPFAKLAIGF